MISTLNTLLKGNRQWFLIIFRHVSRIRVEEP